MNRVFVALICFVLVALTQTACFAQSGVNLESQLKAMKMGVLVKKSQRRGDAKRGAVVFYKSAAACVKCHADDGSASPLGPALTSLGKEITDEHVIESILYPSKKIKEGFETVRVLTVNGDLISGLIADQQGDKIVLRDAADLSKEIAINKNAVELVKKSDQSMMPEGLVASLREEREFYDLVRYVTEVARGGAPRALELKPSPDQLIVKDDTKNLDHAGILGKLDQQDFQTGQRIYLSHCINCHGADGNQPKLATARAFGTQQLKFGADPLSMLRTLSRGNGLMGPMQHLSPKERYQVIHFIREQFMKGRNPGYVAIDKKYLSELPKGTESGEFLVGDDRDYGPVLGSQLGGSINNSLTFRLPNNVTVNYDLHRFRLGGVWTDGFLDLSQTQHYRQRGEQMPKPVGTPIPGLDVYAWELGGSFEIPAAAKPPRGPVRSDWAQYQGHYLFDDQAVISYSIGQRDILETITTDQVDDFPLVQHTFRVAAGDRPLRLCVGKQTRPGDGGVSEQVAFVPNTSAPPYEGGGNENAAVHVVPAAQARTLDLGTPNRTIAVRFKTRRGGTLIASAPPQGAWVPNGKTLFIRGKQLVFDIGWVGAITSKTAVTNNKWHTAVLTVSEDETRLYVDGQLEATREGFRRPPVAGHVLKLGATAANFGGDYGGEIAWAAVYDKIMTGDQIKSLGQTDRAPETDALWNWKPGDESVAAAATVEETAALTFTAAGVVGDVKGLTWEINDEQRLILTIPASREARVFQLLRSSVNDDQLAAFRQSVADRASDQIRDPETMTHGGPTRWPERLTLSGSLGESINGYALDTIAIPFQNPWNAWVRTSALDFFPDGRCVVTTHGGDVYIVSGIDDSLQNVTWKRYAAGLFEPFGVRVVDEQIYVTCRDGIKRLHDYDGNDEADFVEAFWIDDDVSCMFHAYNFDLQTDSKGNFYFAKAGQYTQHHRPGTIMRVPPEGGRADVVAWGIRTPNGMGKLDDDRFTVSDNQGPWMPAGKISLVKSDGFFGNMPINKEQDAWLRAKHGGELPDTFDEPFIWMPQELDNSCGGQVWAADQRWGPLAGRLIHSSFGKGWLYYLSLQEIDGQMQSSIVPLPHQWQAGVMRLRTNPQDGQMYGTGLSGWQGPGGGADGCLQRLRYTGEPVRMIDQVRVVPDGIELTFNFPVGSSAAKPDAWKAQMWNYLWSKKYGSEQYSLLKPGQTGRDELQIAKVQLSDDKRTVTLLTPDLQVCDQVFIKMDFDDARGEPFEEQVYLTVHAVPGKKP